MTLKRSRHGLANLNLFHRTDFVLYVEGGESISKIEALRPDTGSDTGHDAQFWDVVWHRFSNGQTVTIKAVGSKQTVLSIHRDIVANQIDTVLAAVDADLDRASGELVPDKYLITTWGYSWENDVWQDSVFAETLRLLCCRISDDKDVLYATQEVFDALGKDMKWAVPKELAIYPYGKFLFDRKKYRRHLKTDEPTPKLNRSSIKELEKNMWRDVDSTIPIRRPLSMSSCTWRLCFGHLLADFLYHALFGWMLELKAPSKASKSIVHSTAINAFKDLVLNEVESPVAQHFTQEFARVM